MTHASEIGSTKMSQQFQIAVYQPLPLGGSHIEDLTVRAQGYRHTLDAFGGFNDCSFQLIGDLDIVEDWYEEGLGRGVISFSHHLTEMWEGFVNQVTIQQAGLTLRRGPLISIKNRLRAIYSQVDTSTSPPTPGIRKRTAFVDHTESQDRYGIWSGVLSVAGATDENAEQLRDSHLEEVARPKTGQSYSPRESGIVITIECLGYIHSLNYPYNQTVQTGKIDLDEKIRAILGADPNGWVSSNYERISANSLEVKAWEADDHEAVSLLKGLTAAGDADDRRHLFGIYEDRQVVYGPAPTDWEYEIRLADPRREFRTRTGAVIEDWEIRPGNWIFFSDFMPGRFTDFTDPREDPRMVFIESVEFDITNGAILYGGETNKTSQKLARLGLSGFNV